MKERLEQQLQDDFSFMMQNRHEDEQNIYRRWGCECSSGWYDLIHAMCQSIADRYSVEKIPIDLIPHRLKEKFATLHFYYSFEGEPYHIAALDLDDKTRISSQLKSSIYDKNIEKLRKDIAHIVCAYEEKSKSVCEYCGDNNSATIRMDMVWKKTLCNTCYKKYLEQLEKNGSRNYRKEDFLFNE